MYLSFFLTYFILSLYMIRQRIPSEKWKRRELAGERREGVREKEGEKNKERTRERKGTAIERGRRQREREENGQQREKERKKERRERERKTMGVGYIYGLRAEFGGRFTQSVIRINTLKCYFNSRTRSRLS